MSKQAPNPKANAPLEVSLDSGCLRHCKPGPTTVCRNWSACYLCWYDSGEKMSDQVHDPIPALMKKNGLEAIIVPSYVESGIYMIADMISKQRSTGADFPSPTMTSASAVEETPFQNTVFNLRPTVKNGLAIRSQPNFEHDDIKVYWYKHAGRCCYVSREVKGREWGNSMMRILASLGGTV